ncbi:MAG: NAD(P)/FAD-dependent oxidoreductase [Nocardioides sp.]
MVKPQVVIVGGGFAGLFAAKFLRRVDVDVTVIERNNHHLFQPLLYQVATGVLSAGDVAPPLREVLKRHTNVRVVMGEVTGFDLAGRTLQVRHPRSTVEVPYDYLVVGTGVGGSYFGHDEFAPFAPGMKTLEDALALRTQIFGAFEMAELAETEEERAAWLTFAVVGGGPTGVEIAGQITELAQRSLGRNFRRIEPGSARVMLFEGGGEILPGFGDDLSGKATRGLTRLGVDVRVHSRVVGVTRDDISVSGADGEHRFPCRTKVWAAGVAAPPLARSLADAAGAGVDRAGRIKVLPDCTLPGHSEVYVVGDVMSLDDLPGVAEVAMQSGIHAAASIKRQTQGDGEPRPFVYRDLGSMATIARFNSVVEFKGIRASGLLGWLMWAFIHLTFLTGFKNRFLTGFQWVLSFVGRARDERSLTWTALRAAVGDPDPRSGSTDRD